MIDFTFEDAIDNFPDLEEPEFADELIPEYKPERNNIESQNFSNFCSFIFFVTAILGACFIFEGSKTGAALPQLISPEMTNQK